MGYLKKLCDGSLLYSVVNAAEPDADGGCPSRVAFCVHTPLCPLVTFRDTQHVLCVQMPAPQGGGNVRSFLLSVHQSDLC